MSAALVAGGILVSLLMAVEPNSPTRRWPRDAQTTRYIETGYYQRPGLAAPSRTCQGLDQSVSAALREA